jgi:hypothetical protein
MHLLGYGLPRIYLLGYWVNKGEKQAGELLAEAELGEEVARKLLGDLAYRSQELEEELAESGIVLVTSEASARRAGAPTYGAYLPQQHEVHTKEPRGRRDHLTGSP